MATKRKRTKLPVKTRPARRGRGSDEPNEIAKRAAAVKAQEEEAKTASESLPVEEGSPESPATAPETPPAGFISSRPIPTPQDPTKAPLPDPEPPKKEMLDMGDMGMVEVDQTPPPETTPQDVMLEETQTLLNRAVESLEELTEATNYMFGKLRKVPGSRGLKMHDIPILQARQQKAQALIAEIKG